MFIEKDESGEVALQLTRLKKVRNIILKTRATNGSAPDDARSEDGGAVLSYHKKWRMARFVDDDWPRRTFRLGSLGVA